MFSRIGLALAALSLVSLSPPSPKYTGPDGKVRELVGNTWQVSEPPLAPEPSLDELLGKLSALRKQQDDLKKQDEALVAKILKQWADYQKKIADAKIEPPPPPAPPDSFTKAIQDAWAATPDAEKASLSDVLAIWNTAIPYVQTDPDTGTLFKRMAAGFAAAKLQGKLSKILDVINKPLSELLGSGSQPFTADLRAKVSAQMTKTTGILNGLGAK